MNILHKLYFYFKRSAVFGCSVMLIGLYSTVFARPTIPPDLGDPALYSQVKVFKYDQSTQCNQDGIPLKEMQRELTSAGVTVHCSQKGHDGLFRPDVCGGATGAINIYSIDIRNLSTALHLGFSLVSSLPQYKDSVCAVSEIPKTPKVFKYDASTQCNDDGIPLKVMAEDLLKAGIDIKCAQKAHDGLFYPAVCGGATGAINVYEIDPKNITDAQQLGFDPVSSLSEYQDQACKQDSVIADK